MQVNLTHNIDDVIRHTRGLEVGIRDRAVVRALNKTAAQAKIEAGRGIAEEYEISAMKFAKNISVRRARGENLEAAITADGDPLPLHAFRHRIVPAAGPEKTVRFKGTQTTNWGKWASKRVKTGGGVRVYIKGRWHLVPRAFLAEMKSGHKGIFARGRYGGVTNPTGEAFGAFAYGSRRKPVNELYTYSIPQAFSSRVVMHRVEARIRQQFSKVLQQEIRFLLLKR